MRLDLMKEYIEEGLHRLKMNPLQNAKLIKKWERKKRQNEKMSIS